MIAQSSTPGESASCTYANGTASFRVGVSEDRNRRCRRVMEDTHSIQADFCGIQGQGFFGVFDGHGGKMAAEWCGEHFHETLKSCLQENQNQEPIPENKQDHSGCTVITALLTVESAAAGQNSNNVANTNNNNNNTTTAINNTNNSTSNNTNTSSTTNANGATAPIKRRLYTANVGDARAVLCRDGKAIRMSYDHKGADQRESQRITDKGGFMMGNRVNGMLAVTRALGDTAMKEFVIGLPYTQEVDYLWDVCDDQTAIDLIKNVVDPLEASQKLLKYALENFSSDNLTIMVIRFS
ncbi:phosphatase 2C-like domain-containing protein [Syncephalis fuscata]|nr:phosphatase 2C-like domain-containing protein [Syncephalis fuscata]